MSVNISRINKVILLKALWQNSKPAIFFTRSSISPPQFDDKAAELAVKSYIDYFQGRLIKTDLSGNTASPSLYNRDYGNGSFESIVAKLEFEWNEKNGVLLADIYSTVNVSVIYDSIFEKSYSIFCPAEPILNIDVTNNAGYITTPNTPFTITTVLENEGYVAVGSLFRGFGV